MTELVTLEEAAEARLATWRRISEFSRLNHEQELKEKEERLVKVENWARKEIEQLTGVILPDEIAIVVKEMYLYKWGWEYMVFIYPREDREDCWVQANYRVQYLRNSGVIKFSDVKNYRLSRKCWRGVHEQYQGVDTDDFVLAMIFSSTGKYEEGGNDELEI